MTTAVHDGRVCELGEGPLWHPVRRQLFWFDIARHRLMSRRDGKEAVWHFDEPVSAAGWVDEETLIIASASALWRFDISDGHRELICHLENTDDITRSNDGRADPWGGFWIGTMGRNAETNAGAIYRYFQGELRKLVSDVTISNAICFAPDKSAAYYTDTTTGCIMTQPLDRTGWPDGPARLFVDLSARGLNPDGAVVDASGVVWVALWGAARVAGFDSTGKEIAAVSVPALQVTCPAFGGPEFGTMFVTSAAEGLAQDIIDEAPDQGKVFEIASVARGLPEPKVLI